MDRVIAMLPCRGGSEGIPKKNIRPFLGKPLLYWNTEACIDSEMCDQVYVNTDDCTIAGVAMSWCPDCHVYHRPEALGYSDTPTIDVVMDFINWKPLEDRDILIVSQVTSPYLRAEDVAWTIEMLKTQQCDSVMSVTPTHRFLWSHDGNCLTHHEGWRPRRQEWPGTLLENGCLYASRVGTIKSSGVLWGGYLAFLEQAHGFELDSPLDWKVGELTLQEAA